MDKFTASNGAQIVLTNARQTGYVLVERDDDVASAYLGFEEMVAWREFFQAERDEELGRWRWPENPDYVVYMRREDGQAGVLCESTGVTVYRFRGEDEHLSELRARSGEDVMPHTKAARAYFDAHPERKPWDDAKPGEVWLLTLPEIGENAYVAGDHTFTSFDHSLTFGTFRIISGRRIWPEPD